jgi:hypothetical protein
VKAFGDQDVGDFLVDVELFHEQLALHAGFLGLLLGRFGRP